MKEKWVPVKGLENLYSISNHGRLYKKDVGRISKVGGKKGQYVKAPLFIDGKWTSYSMHRLVASHFIREIKPGEEVHHIDEEKSNNIVTNLEILSRKEHAKKRDPEKFRRTYHSNKKKREEKFEWARKKKRSTQ